MSGGSHDYLYGRVRDEYVGFMHDRELDNLMDDIADLLHDLEWYDSCDYGEDTYRESVAKFKEKWFKGSRTERLKGYIDEVINETRTKLMKMIGENDNHEDRRT